ncbi:hypothetical protein B0T14DRAFT_437164 [Immersiella caudata]|uniref:Uncharacterized protein n=1 Tax=Immersiella caudata TaxID=314043 RepID=A0AA40BU19_9PEZI|nr:hypothetical protein B0T14DRAFT_437164 [Immersiella caudata]
MADIECYSSGPEFSSRGQARGWLDHACRGNGGMFTGNFASCGHKAMCPIQDGGIGVLFTPDNIESPVRDMYSNFCVSSMTAIIDNCNRGGEDNRKG